MIPVLKNERGRSGCRERRRPAEVSSRIEQETREVGGLYWLAFLLTGRRDVSIDIAVETISQGGADSFFSGWMRAWSRRLVIAKALAAIRAELLSSARRTALTRNKPTALPPAWSFRRETTKADIEEALLAIDVFPRAALLLLAFERIRLADAATLLDADGTLVKRAQMMGLDAFLANLADKSGDPVPGFSRSRLSEGSAN